MCPQETRGNTLRSCLDNRNGFILGMIVFVFALFGAWFLVQSFLQGHLTDNIKNVANDYISVISSKTNSR